MISIADIIAIMRKYCKLGILLCIIGVVVGFMYGKYVIPTTYVNTAKFYVDTKENVEREELNVEYIVAAQQLVATYIEIFKSDKVLNQVKDNIVTEYTTEQLYGMITCDSLKHTAIMTTSVVSNDPDTSYEINKQLLKYGETEANRVIGSNRMIIIDEPTPTAQPIYPDKKVYMITGLIFGLAAWCVYITLRESKLLKLR